MRVHEMPMPFDRAPQATPKPADAARLYSAFEAVAALTVDERLKGERERPGQGSQPSSRPRAVGPRAVGPSFATGPGRSHGIQVTAGSNAPEPEH